MLKIASINRLKSPDLLFVIQLVERIVPAAVQRRDQENVTRLAHLVFTWTPTMSAKVGIHFYPIHVTFYSPMGDMFLAVT